MKKILTGILSLLLVFTVVAEEHPLGKITGHNASLVTFDHAFAGEINGSVAFGVLDESTFTSELTIRKYEQTIRAEFKKIDEVIGGTINYKKDEREVSLSISLVRVDGENKQIILNVVGETVVVQITPENYVDGHFINPMFSFTLNDKEYAYKMEGEACYGMAMHFVMMLISANII